MKIRISNTSGESIYAQLKEQLKEQLISGEIAPDTALPSIRAFAKDLHISVITVKRAYEELEREGYIYTIAQKGSFAAARDNERIKEEYLSQIEERLREIKRLCRTADIKEDELRRIGSIIWEDEDECD